MFPPARCNDRFEQYLGFQKIGIKRGWLSTTIYLSSNLMNSLSEPFYISCCDTSYGYSTIFGCVDGVLISCVSGTIVSKWKSMIVTSLANLSICSGVRPV